MDAGEQTKGSESSSSSSSSSSAWTWLNRQTRSAMTTELWYVVILLALLYNRCCQQEAGGYRGKPKQLQHLLVDDHPNGVSLLFGVFFCFPLLRRVGVVLVEPGWRGVLTDYALIRCYIGDRCGCLICNLQVMTYFSWCHEWLSPKSTFLFFLGGVESQKGCL